MNFRIIALLVVLLTAACVNAPQLSLDVTPARNAHFEADPFREALRVGYLEFYDYEKSQGHDEKANLYGRKALATAHGLIPEMEGVFDRNLPLERLNAILGAKYFLESAFANGTKEMDPNTSAKAQLMFDCWGDQEEIRAKQKGKRADQTSCETEFNKIAQILQQDLSRIKAEERAKEQARIDEEKRQLEAYHRSELSRALAMQKKELRKLPEYSLLFFRFNSTTLGITAQGILDKVAKDIVLFKPRKVIVSGHTDLIGGYEYNMKLAVARGKEAASYLIKRHGIDPMLIDVKAYGENKPRINEDKDQKDVRNRYVQITFEFDNKFYVEQ